MKKGWIGNRLKDIAKIDVTFLIGCLIGAFIFVFIYGFKILNVTYDDWLMQGGDLTQHYIGWRFFRNSEWHFPIGLMNNITYPNKVSIIYMDSIPIFAVVFKLLSPILPKTFQYFGLWGIFCFMLQGGLAALIIKVFTKDILIASLTSTLFVLSPVMIFRMFWHSALAGHWIILLSIYIYLNRSCLNTLFKKMAIWNVIIGIASSIHIYFIPMIFIIMVGYLLCDYLENRNILETLIVFLTSILFGLFILFILGAFVGNMKVGSSGLGDFSANLNSIINPQGWSKYLKDLELTESLQYEGIAYLGLGILILCVISIYIYINNKLGKKIKETNRSFKISIIMIIILTYILAISNIVTLGKNIIFTIPYPNFILEILSIFRATGRFMWIVCYIVDILVIGNLVINNSKKVTIPILIICSIIQFADISEILILKNKRFNTMVEYNSNLKADIWQEISNKGYEHIVFMDDTILYDYEQPKSNLWALSKYAVDNNMSISNCFLARKDIEAIDNTKFSYIEDLEKGIVKDKTIYISYNINSILKKEYPLNYYYINNFVIGLKDKIDNEKYYYTSQIPTNKINIYEYLEKLLNPNYITIVSAKDEFSYKLNDKILEQLRGLGFKCDLKDKYRWSYIGVINSNKVEFEEVKDAKLSFSKQIDNLEVNVISAGMTSGNISSIKLNGKEYSLNLRGLNIVVYDKRIGKVVDIVSFDTHEDLKAYR